MECLGGHAEWARDDKVAHAGDEQSASPASNDAQTAPSTRPSILLHDATFLNAVLPFALNQSRRHREPLSILCMAIDRQRSVQELLGRAEVDRLIRHVGEITGSLIRTSDILARLDDDRVVAVLPRAPRGGALRVAEKICRAVAENRPADCNTPNPTVSIGVATFPSCSENVYSLFDAADEALAWAQNHGRNQAVLAPPRRSTTPVPGQRPGCRVHRLTSPIHHRAVVRVIRLAILPVVADLVGHRVFIELDPQPRAGGQIEIALAHGERRLQVAHAQADLLLAEKIGDRSGDLDSRRPARSAPAGYGARSPHNRPRPCRRSAAPR